MAFYRCGGGGIPSSLKTDMNAVLNKKFGTSIDYPPQGWPDDVNLMGPLPEGTASGSIVTFSDGADDVPLKSCEVALSASLDGYSSITVHHTDGQTPPVFSEDYTVSLGRTIHGGSVDVVNGKGNNGSILIDLSELTWNMDNDTRFRSRQTDYTGASGWSGSWQNTDSNRFVCENPTTAFTNRSDYSFANIPQNYYNFDIKVPTGIYANANEFKTWLANIDGNGTHAVVVIDRLTAELFTFEPVEISSRLGNNTMWSDGDMSVTYRRDINLALGGQ